VNHVQRTHSGDVLIAAVVIVSQSWIAWMLFTKWKSGLSRPLFRFMAASFAVVWAVCALSLYLNISPEAHFPVFVRGAASAVEIAWGFLSTCAIAVYFLYRAATQVSGANHLPARRLLLQRAAAAAIAAPVAAMGFGALIERTRFTVREVDFPIPNLHPDLEGFRVAQISDIHAGLYLSVRHVARVVDMTNELKPHLALVTGDLISEMGDPLDATIDQLARLRADTGVLGCLGNHEVYAGCESYTAERGGRRGIQFLRGDARQVQWGRGVLNVAGVDFQPFRHKDSYLRDAGGLVVPGMPNLLLSHNPDVFPVAVRQGYDAVVGGHTHGGQVTVEILNQSLNFARFFTPFVAGLYRMQGRSCYVSAGIGTIGMPVRVGAPPEITVLRLRRA
jgi:predicted MPP superfamily phosphohydrolase